MFLLPGFAARVHGAVQVLAILGTRSIRQRYQGNHTGQVGVPLSLQSATRCLSPITNRYIFFLKILGDNKLLHKICGCMVFWLTI